jgi:hypothetical protein
VIVPPPSVVVVVVSNTWAHAKGAVTASAILSNLYGDECDQLHQKYFELHREMTASNEWLLIDLRLAFQQPLSNVTPTFRRVSAEKKFVE